MTLAERTAIIARLEAANLAAKERQQVLLAKYEHAQRLLQLATDIYVDTIAAPWRALAEELRR